MRELIVSLTNEDIERIARKELKLRDFRGIFSKDALPAEPLCRGESVVVNLQDFLAGGSTHWVCAFRDPALRADEGGVDYFDSFGLPPPDVVKVWLTRSGCVMYYGNEIYSGPPIDYVWMVLPPLPSRSRPRLLGHRHPRGLLDFDVRLSERNEHIIIALCWSLPKRGSRASTARTAHANFLCMQSTP